MDANGENEAAEDPSCASDALSRRAFLKGAAAGAVTALVLNSTCSEGADDNASDDDDNDEDVEPPPNRVVRVIDSDATTWDGGDFSDFYRFGVQEVVDEMFKQGLKALTDADSLEDAWRSLLPYRDGELIGIHVNAYVNNDNSRKNNIYQPMSALVKGLVDELGVPADMIAVTDVSRTLKGSPAQQRLIDQCAYTDELQWDQYRGEYSDVTIDIGTEVNFSRLMVEADHVILVPVLSWHSGGALTGAMKLMIGAIDTMSAAHQDGGWIDTPKLADICMPLKKRVRLVVGEGLFGNVNGNSSSPHAFETLGGQGRSHPSSAMYFSRDMVALDSVMFDDLLFEQDARGVRRGRAANGYLRYAADDDHKLGTFEMLADTGNDSYKKIDFVEIA